MIHDLRFALRLLAKERWFTMVAIASLALGIGANTAIFSLINALMLRMLPVRAPQQLVQFMSVYPGEPRMNGLAGASDSMGRIGPTRSSASWPMRNISTSTSRRRPWST